MAAPRLVIFDLDGTLVDASPDLHTAVNLTLGARHLPLCSLADIRSFIGDGARELVSRSLAEEQRSRVDEILPEFFANYHAHVFEKTYAYPGVGEMLGQLDGVTKAVSSNKPEKPTREILSALGWMGHFTCVVGGDSLPFKKPDPRMLTSVCERIGVGPSQTVMVGDGPQDISAAHAAGIRCISVAWGFTPAQVLKELGADHIAGNPAEVVDILANSCR